MRNQTLSVRDGKAYTRAGIYHRKSYPLTEASAFRITRLAQHPDYKVFLSASGVHDDPAIKVSLYPVIVRRIRRENNDYR